ncbi:MAG: DUF4105 domain-containing protein [Myxococcota bacterium]
MWWYPAAAEWWVDASSLAARRGDWPMRAAVTCPAEGASTLGVAVVVYARKQGSMAWGHVSLRVVGCRDGRLEDFEYETYRLSDWNLRSFREEHPGEPFLEHIDDQRGALVLFRNVDPVDRGWFADAQAHNREIYELWLDTTPAERDRIASTAAGWYTDQRDQLRRGERLPERYRALSTNCTTVLARTLEVSDPPVLPFAWMRLLEDTAQLRVLHPSHHLAARWDTWPAQLDRPHPLLRRPASVPSVPDLPPLVPWDPP